MSKPKLLLVDEMSLGPMPILVEKVMEILRDISQRGMMVILVEQKVQELLKWRIGHTCYKPATLLLKALERSF